MCYYLDVHFQGQKVNRIKDKEIGMEIAFALEAVPVHCTFMPPEEKSFVILFSKLKFSEYAFSFTG